MQWNIMTSSNGNFFRVTGHLCGEFTGPGEFPAQRPVTRSFDVFFDLRLNKRLSKQSRGWWFETLSRPLWRHCNETSEYVVLRCCSITVNCIPNIKSRENGFSQWEKMLHMYRLFSPADIDHMWPQMIHIKHETWFHTGVRVFRRYLGCN